MHTSGLPHHVVEAFARLYAAGSDRLQACFYDRPLNLEFFSARVLPLMTEAELTPGAHLPSDRRSPWGAE